MKIKNYIFFPILIAICFFFIGASKPDQYKKVKKNLSLINDVYRYLVTNYVDDIDLDAFTKMSIDNMLMDLDPYTVFLENEERNGIEMLTKGKYGGVGIQIGKRDNILTVISPMENSPAKRAGILAGDRVIKIDGKETIEMSMDAAAKMIRGEKGTHVILTIERFSENEWTDYSLIREDIKVNDVFYSGMLDDQTGYIRLTRFSKNSAKEVKKSLRELLDKNMASLIIDLRDNPGGLLNSAVDILDIFIDQDETLVRTAGKTKRSHRQYRSKSIPLIPNDINLAVLINQGSASASEIVSGVIQDLDRGVVIGRPSFGKGLVQTVYKIDRERSLKITTAKYYIPSGRLIQKPGYLPEDIMADTSAQDTIFETIGGRTVMGGGGISPDYHIKLDSFGPIFSACSRKGIFFSFVQKNKQLYDTFIDVESDSSLIAKFEEYVHDSNMDILMKGESNYLDMKDFFLALDSGHISIQGAIDILDQYFEEVAVTQFEREEAELKHRILVEFADYYYGIPGRMKRSLKKDKDVLKAISILHDPIAYKDIFLPQ